MRLVPRLTRKGNTADGARNGRGQSVVEFAMLVPVLLFMLLIAIDFGRLFFSYVQLQNAVREAAAYGAADPTNQAVMEARANQERNSQRQAGDGTFTLLRECRSEAGTVILCTAAPGGGGAGNTLTVTLQTRFNFLTPLINSFFGGGGLNMTASTTTAVLGSVAAGGGGPGASACPPPTFASFVVTSVDLTVTVDPADSRPNTVPCAISGYNWDFGWTNTDRDLAVGSALPATHTYPGPGTYTITLQVTNQGGSLTTTRQVTVPAPPPTPSPTPSPSPTGSDSGSPSPSSSGSPSPSVSATPSPSPTPSACQVPNADFTWTIGNPRRNVTFSDRSSYDTGCPITTWLWDFGDGSPSSNAVNPAHEFPNNTGRWTVRVTVTNSAGSATRSREVDVR